MNTRMPVRALFVLSLGLAPLPALGQSRPDGMDKSPESPQPAAAEQRLISVAYKDLSLREALADLQSRTARTLRPLWSDAADPIGLDPDARLSLTITRAPLTSVIEALLRTCETGLSDGATWQVAEDGAIELGPRSRLNRHPVTRIYDVRDLLAAVPDFPEGATLDLQAALQARQGGSVIRDDDRASDLGAEHRADRAQDLIDLITQTIEPDQWWSAGGSATIRVFGGLLVIRAPEYVHRQVVERPRVSGQ